MGPLTAVPSSLRFMQQPASSKLPQEGPQKNKALKKIQQARDKDMLTSTPLVAAARVPEHLGLDHSLPYGTG